MTTDHPTLDLAPLVVPVHEPEATIAERFAAFHDANAWVLLTLIALADDAKRHGRKRIGIKHLVEIVRWQYGRETFGAEFRVNNDFSSRYVRLIVEQRPDLAPLFQMRRLRAA